MDHVVRRLPDRRREVAASPELDEAISDLLELARLVKARQHRGPLSNEETLRMGRAISQRTSAFQAAVRQVLEMAAD